MPLKRVTVTLPDPLAAQLDTLRQTERISVSSVAEVALRAYLSAYGKGAAGDNLRASGATLRRRRGGARGPVTVPPAEERQRLEALRKYEILDTPPDGTYDAVTALAASVFNVSIALVSIVDEDRIWFKSRFGLDEVSEIPREPGLCASAICNDETYVVESASTDPRALANPLVAGEFGLQFYAAAPLITRDGYRLGTFCLLDRAPRQMSAVELQMLETFAALVMSDLDLRMQAMSTVAAERISRSS